MLRQQDMVGTVEKWRNHALSKGDPHHNGEEVHPCCWISNLSREARNLDFNVKSLNV